ncbi:MAG TPA: hypothetical protein VF816_05355 [Rhodocyclaceae bacterium]
MSIVATVAPEQSAGLVAEIYAQMKQAFGFIPNAFRLFSVSPAVMDNQWQNNRYYFHHATLSFPLLASIRMLVSEANDCDYCIGMNAALLIQHAGFTPDQIAAMKRDPAAAPLPEKDKAMLQFVLKATRAPKTVAPADLDALRALGWNDGEIFDAVNHGARNVAVDILFNTFKIENDF